MCVVARTKPCALVMLREGESGDRGSRTHGRGVLVNGVQVGMAPDGTATETKGVERAASTPVSVPGRWVVLCRQAVLGAYYLSPVFCLRYQPLYARCARRRR